MRSLLSIALFACTVLAKAAPAFAQTPGDPPVAALYWLEQNPENGPFNPNQRHLRSTEISNISANLLASYHGRNQYYGIDVDSNRGKVYTYIHDFDLGQVNVIRESDLDGSNSTIIYQYVSSSGGQLKFEPTEGKLYVFNGNAIDRMNTDGSGFETIFSDVSVSFTAADIDHANSKLVFLDGSTGQFRTLDFDGSNPVTLGATCPLHTCGAGLAVDGAASKFYYSRRDAGDNLWRVYEQSFDGVLNQSLYGPFSAQANHGVNSIALDFATDQLYIAHGRQAFGQGLSRAAADGSLLELDYFNAALGAAPVRLAIGSTQALSVEVSAPTITATYNEAITVPVALSNAAGVIAAEVFIEYDTALLTFSSVSSTGTLTDGWAVETNLEAGVGTLQTLKIAAANDASSATGAQTLINVNFTVNDVRAPASSALTLTHVLLNDGAPNGSATNGLVTLVGNDATGSTDVASAIPRESITVTITDIDEDLDGLASSDQVTVAVSNGAQTETLTLNETATQGEFTGIMTTVFSASSTSAAHSGDGTVQAKAGDQIGFSFSDQLKADGSAGTLVLTPVNVIGGTDGAVQITDATQPGDVVYIKVTDADLNTNNAAAETAQVVVTSSNGETETVTVTEVDVDDDVFFGQLASAAGATAGTDEDGTINGQKGDVLTATYDDVVTAVGDQLDRLDTDQVVDPFGDADGNATVQAFDAAQTLLHVLVPHLTGLELIQANVDTDPAGTGVTPFDAALILQKRVGLISVFPVQQAASTNHPQPTPASPKAVVQTRPLALVYGDGYLSLRADERDGILSGDVLLAGIDGPVALGEELGQFIISARRTDEGLRVVFAGAEAVSGPGELLRVYPGVGPDKASLARARFNDGRIVGHSGASAAPANAPLRYALHGNWPNPFNPETSVRFDLPQAGAVRLEVFDMLGQKVRTLAAGTRAAGSHQVTWNGRDESGWQVGSGVYIYRLQAGDFVRTRRMMLLK